RLVASATAVSIPVRKSARKGCSFPLLSDEKIRKRSRRETNRFVGAGRMLVVAGSVKRTTAFSVVGSEKRTNPPTEGKGLTFFAELWLVAANVPGIIASTARRVMPFFTTEFPTEKDAELNRLVPRGVAAYNPRSLCLGLAARARVTRDMYL